MTLENSHEHELLSPLSEAESFHAPAHGGFCTVNFASPSTKKNAELVRLVCTDIKDYENGQTSLAIAQNSALLLGLTCDCMEDRIQQLKDSIKGKSPTGVVQTAFRVQELPSAIAMLTDSPDFGEMDCWISQNGFSAPNRRATNVLHLNMLFVDIDIDKAAAAGENPATQRFVTSLKALKPECRAQVFVQWCEDNFVPLPSLIVHSGGGLHCKWLFTESVPREVKPVWDALELNLIKRLADGHWPVDEAVRDVSRILRVAGSKNQKVGYLDALVRVVWINGPNIGRCLRYDFNDLADGKQILPWSREEFREAKKIWQIWDANRKAASEESMKAMAFVRSVSAPSHGVQQLLVADLWHRRLSAIRSLVRLRYGHSGVPEGQRNTFAWLAANALAWSAGGADDYDKDLVPVISEIAPTLTSVEIQSAASSVSRRVREEIGRGKGLFKMCNSTFAEHLKITNAEAALIFRRQGVRKKSSDAGIMGFEKMKNLPLADFKKETFLRRVASARRTAEIKAASNADNRIIAIEMRAKGASMRAISKVVGVSKSTVENWVNFSSQNANNS